MAFHEAARDDDLVGFSNTGTPCSFSNMRCTVSALRFHSHQDTYNPQFYTGTPLVEIGRRVVALVHPRLLRSLHAFGCRRHFVLSSKAVL